MRLSRLLSLPIILLLSACDMQPIEPALPLPDAPDLLLVVSPVTFTQVSAGYRNSCAVKTDSSVVCWGYEYELSAVSGTPTGTGFSQVDTSSKDTCAVKTDGSIVCWGGLGDTRSGPITGTPTETGFSQVSVGLYHACAIKTIDGTLVCWGGDHFDQVSEAPTGTGFTQVQASTARTCAVNTDGSVVCWGDDTFGEVSAIPSGEFTQVTTAPCAVSTDSSIVCWGRDGLGFPAGAPTGTGFTQVTAGHSHRCALRTDGSLVCWGHDGDFGEGKVSGTPTGTGFTQVSAGDEHTCALKTDGSVVCWGKDIYGQVSNIPTITNTVLPVATFNAPVSVDEGDTFMLSLTDAHVPGYSGSVSFTYAFECGDVAWSGNFFSSNSVNCLLAASDDGTLSVVGRVRDQDGDMQVYTSTVTVNNVAPTITSVTGPGEPIGLVSGSAVATIAVAFTDPGPDDTHTTLIDCGNSTSAVSGDCTYGAAGVYTITATVTDDDGGSDTAVYEYVVVFDPSAGFVTGGGWIDSPAGAYAPDPSLSGKAHFGFVSRYGKGADSPTGSTEFQFQVAGLNFHSDVQEWLVVNRGGMNAQFKGTGTINGMGSYGFMVWAGDGSPDTFRIRLWEEIGGGEVTIYDNGSDQATSGGNILIHAK